jgi:hypothetical protein
MGTLRRASRHKGSERIRDSLDRLMRVVVTVPLPDRKTGEPRILKTHSSTSSICQRTKPASGRPSDSAC